MNGIRTAMIGVAAIAVATAALGQGGPIAGGEGRERFRERFRGGLGVGVEEMAAERLIADPDLAKEIGLTDAQAEQLKTLRFDTREKMIALNAAMETAALKQAELLSQDAPDEKTVLKAVEETGTATTEIAKLKVRQLLAMKKILTAEQQDKIKTVLRERMQERAQNWSGNRGRGPRGAGGPPGAPMPPQEGGAPNPPPGAPMLPPPAR